MRNSAKNNWHRWLLLAALLASNLWADSAEYLVFEPPAKLDREQHIVIVTGDEEYRSEEWGPMLGKILSQKHGFKTTVLFALDPETGIIDPNNVSNIPGLRALDTADLMILATRWRKLPAEQMKPVLDYLDAAKPLIAIRTATHAFKNDEPVLGYDWKNFGINVVGENWLNHHGEHKVQGGRSVIEAENSDHPILNHAAEFFTWSDIYGIENLDQQSAEVLLRGAVTESLDPDSTAVPGDINDPMMPLAWLKPYPTPSGEGEGVCFATTAGAAVDFSQEGLRRLIVNASYFLLGQAVPEKADVEPVDRYEPSFYGFMEQEYFLKRGLRVNDFKLGSSARSVPSEGQVGLMNSWPGEKKLLLKLAMDDSLALVGNGLAERMLHYGYFESELYARNADKDLRIRMLARPGMTPAFRPHSSRNSQWAFPGAEALRPEFEHHSGLGNHPSPDEWLTQVGANRILAFFGYNESFDGPEGEEAWKAELRAFVRHTLGQQYDGKAAPQLILVSPIAFQDLSANHDLPDGVETNRNLALYTRAMGEVANEMSVGFVDVYTPTLRWFTQSAEQLTVNGAHFNEEGYRRFSVLLADLLQGEESAADPAEGLVDLVREKNFHWFNRYQMPNGVHVDGRRFEPYGPDNYPFEITKTWQLTENREAEIHAFLNGELFDRAAADAETIQLKEVETNAPERADQAYLYGQDALDSFTVANGYRLDLFVSESQFPNMANPVQITFDGRGRLWVSVMPSYPHYKPGDPRPDDKILIYEDTDGDGQADKETIFADGLHLPIGFEITADGVWLSQAPNLVLLKDTDGDDVADSREIILSGFDTHDTHHAISAFTRDNWGSLFMGEGVFLHTNVETAYGPVRAVNGGFYRFTPHNQKLERIVQTHIPNPWGIAFDEWGEDFFLSTSNPDMHWMLPVEVNTHYGELIVGTESLIEEDQRVRPTSGLVFVSSTNFPEAMQGDFVLNNVIGFLGAKQHTLEDANESAGYTSRFRKDLFQSSDPNFRPVDVDFAPDGSLYIVDWHNQLVGHMQHNARDPLRDHAHGRVYRLRHIDRPLAKVQNLSKLDTDDLWGLLAGPDIHQRSRVRRELRRRTDRDREKQRVRWQTRLEKRGQLTDALKLEALWVNSANPDTDLVRDLLRAETFQARAAAVRAVRYYHDRFDDVQDLLLAAAQDEHPRVRLEAVIASTRVPMENALAPVEAAAELPVDGWSRQAYLQSAAYLGGTVDLPEPEISEEDLAVPEEIRETWLKGREIYGREGHCATCHQADGKGLPAAQFPPLAGTGWVTGSPDRLIDIALNGLTGPIDVGEQHFPGHVPMTQFKGLLDNEEMAAVLTYVRNAFGNEASAITPEQVDTIRQETADMAGFWQSTELIEKYGPE